MIPPVVKSITVPCTPDAAFTLFTRDMARWWPLGKNSVSANDGHVAQSVTMELHVGGALTELGHDGQSHRWGTVKVFEPGQHLQLAWHINAPESEATVVDVHFSATEKGTRVELTHTGWEAFADRAEAMREGYNSGWVGVFEQAFGQAAALEAA